MPVVVASGNSYERANTPAGSLGAGIEQLARRVEEDLARLQAEGERSEMYRTLALVLGVLGGCAVVAVDTAAAAATTGVAAPLLEGSLPLGVEIINSITFGGFGGVSYHATR